MLLKDRVAIVTGASSGIGRGIALELGGEGAKVVVADVSENPKVGQRFGIDKSPTAEAIKEANGEAVFLGADISSEKDVKRLIEKTVKAYGGIDIVVNNAGILVPKNMEDISIKEWQRVVDINLTGTFMVTKFAMMHLKQSQYGRVINISSQQAYGGGGGPSYTATKAALVNMTRDTAVELAPDSVTVNVICPGFIETPLQDYHTEASIKMAKQRTPLPRFGKPFDVGRAAVFLASDDAEWITGTSLVVDGGWLAPV
ncbi:SDR family NAD(P)-dependent oxidoreductase [Poriferisphaera sp. WC338]|uniref:SDR family NAD(P)-dependent oxidoreductase n=1 Tax=Poriferisphaera sp. WC338 TaxID=3425129 RepID=UPI003D812BF8